MREENVNEIYSKKYIISKRGQDQDYPYKMWDLEMKDLNWAQLKKSSDQVTLLANLSSKIAFRFWISEPIGLW